MAKLNPNLIRRFYKAQPTLFRVINLHNTRYNVEDGDIDIYLDTIKKSRWYGPYEKLNSDSLYLFSITKQGDNEYYAVMVIAFSPSQQVYLLKMKNMTPLFPFETFTPP